MIIQVMASFLSYKKEPNYITLSYMDLYWEAILLYPLLAMMEQYLNEGRMLSYEI